MGELGLQDSLAVARGLSNSKDTGIRDAGTLNEGCGTTHRSKRPSNTKQCSLREAARLPRDRVVESRVAKKLDWKWLRTVSINIIRPIL